MLEHEQQYVQYHLRMVWRHLQDTVQHLKVSGPEEMELKMPQQATSTDAAVQLVHTPVLSTLHTNCHALSPTEK